ncbi:hypothetical protein SAMN04487770_13212 [Butyrivibrio sp. ob235]|uniref:hypothetical protein n=1 Tax=Butyrivibrio sp. ob235 TaxID=1761780 RepID=UPI0008CDF25B|nr:hypothetical protein [Butyrivibrio sp. ob235]SEM28356.1 hypothetical protein SAMN04487770_13212 [Butyrivibrio sp. ob235]
MRNKIISVMLVGVMATALCACGDGTPVDSSIEDKVQAVVEAEDEDTALADDLPDSAGSYKKAYQKVVDDLSSAGDADMFALVDVNDDDIPELAASSSEGSWDKDQVFLYTADAGKAVLLASDIGPGMEGHFIAYIEKGNVFIKSGAPTGEYYTFYVIGDNQPEEFFSAGHFQMLDDNDNEVETYMIDEEEVTKDEYDSQLNDALESGEFIMLAEPESLNMVKYNVSFKDGYMALEETEEIPYLPYDEISELLAE